MLEAPLPILSTLILLPLVFALMVMSIRNTLRAKQMAILGASLELILSLIAVKYFDADLETFQLVEHFSWINLLNIEYLIGVDGISILFLPLSALLILVTLLAAWNSVQNLKHLHVALLLTLESITMGVFCALDTLLFFLFWELSIPVIFFLIGLWGIGPQRRSAAIKYTLFMLCSGVPILFAIILLAVNHATQAGGSIPQDLAFSLPVLFSTPLEDKLQPIIFILFLIGFSVKAPLVPFHTWLPTVSMEAPAQITALLMGIKLGIYGILRYAMSLAPSAAVQYSWVLGILGAITMIYGALIALQQSNLRRLLAYASISQVGLVVIGLTSLNMQGIQGTLLQLLNFTLVTSSLMLIAGFIQHRLGSTDVIHLGGIAKVMPKLTAFYFLFALASIGIPGSSIFPAELLLVIGAFNAHPSLGITALVGAILSAGYVLAFTRKAFLGPVVHAGIQKLQDLRPREITLLCLPALLVLVFGLFPNELLKMNKVSAEAWLSRLVNQPVLNIKVK